MIPSREELVEAYGFFARRMKLEVRAEEKRAQGLPIGPLEARTRAIDAALRAAHDLVESGGDEISAVLYGFASHPRCFPLAVYAFTTLIAKNVATSNGKKLSASVDEFKALIAAVMERRCGIDEVRHWVESHAH